MWWWRDAWSDETNHRESVLKFHNAKLSDRTVFKHFVSTDNNIHMKCNMVRSQLFLVQGESIMKKIITVVISKYNPCPFV